MDLTAFLRGDQIRPPEVRQVRHEALHAGPRACRKLLGFVYPEPHQRRAGVVVGRPRVHHTRGHLVIDALDSFQQSMRLRPVGLVEPDDRGAEQRHLVGEVPVQPAARHLRDLGHLRYRGSTNSLGAQAHFGRVDQPIAYAPGGRAARHPVLSSSFIAPQARSEHSVNWQADITGQAKDGRQIRESVHLVRRTEVSHGRDTPAVVS